MLEQQKAAIQSRIEQLRSILLQEELKNSKQLSILDEIESYENKD